MLEHTTAPILFKVELYSDSECHLKSLSITKTFKSILMKKIMRNIHVMVRDLTSELPIKLSFSYVSSQENIADTNSKLVFDPIFILNSKIWRNGHPWFLDANFPAPGDTYLTVYQGDPVWTPPSATGLESSSIVCCLKNFEAS